MTIVAVAISHYLTSSELARTKSELQLVRKDLNYIHSEGTDDIYAVALPTYGPLQWRWRIQLPVHGTYRLRSAVGIVPESELPSTSEIHNEIFLDRNGRPIAGGVSILLSVAIFVDEKGKWRIMTETAERNLARPIANAPSWLDSHSQLKWTTKVFGKDRTVSSDAHEPLILLRKRESLGVPGGGFTVNTNPAAGIVIWVEKNPETPKP